jgi:hypothetical protein
LNHLAKSARGIGPTAANATGMGIRLCKDGRSPIEFKLDDLANVRKALADSASYSQVCAAFGVAQEDVDTFFEQGLIKFIDGVGAGALQQFERVSKTSLNQILATINARALPCTVPKEEILTISRVVSKVKILAPDWARAYRAIADGHGNAPSEKYRASRPHPGRAQEFGGRKKSGQISDNALEAPRT